MSETLINYLNTPGADEADLESALIGRIPLVGARATMSANLTGQNYTSGAAVTFNSEDYDTNGFHDTSTNSDRLTIPSGMAGYYKVTFNIMISSITADVRALANISWRNSEDTVQFTWSQSQQDSSTQRRISVSSPIVYMNVGDYVTNVVLVTTDTSVDVDSGFTDFAIERVATTL